MKQLEVRKNAKRNIVIGIINNIVVLIFPFVTRTIIKALLGSLYLGMNSLFTSVLSVLSLTELGLSGAMVYHMYKPIADGDTRKINALLSLYQKAYRIIGLIIIGIGLCLLPFLRNLVNGEVPDGVSIYIVFLIELGSTALSYFLFAYKTSILAAHQRADLTTLSNLIVSVGLKLSQIFIIYLTRNYYLYLAITPIFNIANNLWIAYITKKMFPEYKPSGSLDKDTLTSIKKLVAGTFIQKACSTTRNSLDSIFISSFLGLALTGIYNNYYVIFNAVVSLMAIAINALSGGIGNHVATKSIDDNFKELKQLDFLYMSFAGICTSCMLCLYQPFMQLWMGKDMLLDFRSIILLCLYFYILKMGDVKTLYSTANGLWWKMRYRSIVETICNAGLNFVLGKYFGVDGIIFATMISLFFCNFIWGSVINFDNYFGKERLKTYYLYHATYALEAIVFCTLSYLVCQYITIENLLLNFIVKGIVAFVAPTLLYFIISCKKDIFKSSVKMLLKK